MLAKRSTMRGRDQCFSKRASSVNHADPALDALKAAADHRVRNSPRCAMPRGGGRRGMASLPAVNLAVQVATTRAKASHEPYAVSGTDDQRTSDLRRSKLRLLGRFQRGSHCGKDGRATGSRFSRLVTVSRGTAGYKPPKAPATAALSPAPTGTMAAPKNKRNVVGSCAGAYLGCRGGGSFQTKMSMRVRVPAPAPRLQPPWRVELVLGYAQHLTS